MIAFRYLSVLELIFLSIHYYDPCSFTLMEDPASCDYPSETRGADAEKQALAGRFDRQGTFSTNKTIPVIWGEFAVNRGQNVVRDPSSRILRMESVAEAALSRGMV
ncbi:MAG: hypothetical protein JXA30_11095 [Deltaproteobacteria bacterium]|nr:hypothetical protein [Deltaproteobacteria bacterium]